MTLALLNPMAGGFLALDSTDTWVLVAFLVFIGVLIYAGAFGAIGRALDARAARIRDQITEARELREEAQRKLAAAERQHKDAETRAQEIVARARDEAAELAAKLRADIDAQVARRLQAAEDQIKRAELEAERAVRNAAVDAAIDGVAEVMRGTATADGQAQLIDQAISEATPRFNA